jgi:hypothetical protein
VTAERPRMQPAAHPEQGLHKVPADQSRLVGEPLWRVAALGKQQQPRGFHCPAGDDHCLCGDSMLFAVGITVNNRRHAVVVAGLDLRHLAPRSHATQLPQ